MTLAPIGFSIRKGITLIEQVMRDPGHLPVPPECHDKVGARRLQHLSVVREGRRAPHLGRSSGDETSVRVLDGN